MLNKLSKVALPPEVVKFIHDSTANYGKVLKSCRLETAWCGIRHSL